MENTHEVRYPGGWELTDDSCLQYVRRIAPRSFELIEYGLVSHEGPLYEVYADTICLGDYSDGEMTKIIRGSGYEDLDDLRRKYGSHGMANQVAAECIFEWYGSHAVEPICTDVTEEEAEAAIMRYLASHNDVPAYGSLTEISMDALVAKAMALNNNDALEFRSLEDAFADDFPLFRIVKLAGIFDEDQYLINRACGGDAMVIDMATQDGTSSEVMRYDLAAYFERIGVRAVFINEDEKTTSAPVCWEVENLEGMDWDKLHTKEEALAIIHKHGDCENGIAALRDHYHNQLGFDPIWRQHVGDDCFYGAVIVPVREGFLYLPYDEVRRDEWEIYILDIAELLTREMTEYLLKLTSRYMEPYQAVLRHITQVLREKEAAESE